MMGETLEQWFTRIHGEDVKTVEYWQEMVRLEHAELVMRDKCIAELEARVRELEETLGGYKVIHYSQAGEIDKLILAREQEKERAAALETKVRELEKELSEERIAESNMEIKYEDAKRERDDWRAQAELLDGRLQDALHDNAELRAERDEWRDLSLRYEKDAAELRAERDEWQYLSLRYEKDAAGLRAVIATLQRDLREADVRADAWREQHDALWNLCTED